MKRFIEAALLIAIAASSSAIFGQYSRQGTNGTGSFLVTAVNQMDIYRPDEMIRLDLAEIEDKFPSFNAKGFFVSEDDHEIPSQISEGELGKSSEIIFVASFAPMETKTLQISWEDKVVDVHHYPRMTQAAMGMKVGYEKVNGYYTGGRFVDVDSTTVPHDHFAHDALYRVEGPGWESGKIAYRFYLDSRNRNDIFGKKTHGLVLETIGENDLISDSRESYTKMLDWGMDIFKVGESLGIGSIAMWHDSQAATVGDVAKVECSVFNGPIRSGVFTKYLGWKTGGKEYNLVTDLSISAGSRLTKVSASINNDTVLLCTGLAKHDSCDLMGSVPSAKGVWRYLALYGKQSLSGDNLGIAVFYRKTDMLKLTHDGTSQIVVLRPTDGRLTYYFGAAWEEEPGGIKSEKEFKEYLERTASVLDDPIGVYF